MVFLFDVRRSEFLLQRRFGRGVQHFLTDFGRVGGVADQKPLEAERRLIVQPEENVAWRILFDQRFNKLRIVFFPIVLHVVASAKRQLLCACAKWYTITESQLK